MTDLEAAYRVVTPMFCGGPRQEAELRLASFKGVLRFWWRALAWSRLDGDLDRIQKREAELFGSSGSGQSRVYLRWERRPKRQLVAKGTSLPPGRAYLAGMGLASWSPQDRTMKTTRAAVASRTSFTVQARLLKGDEADIEELTQALMAMGLFGGLGSRTRRGWGSLTLESLKAREQDEWTSPGDVNDLETAITQLVRELRRPGTAEYTAFSADTRIILCEGSTSEAPEALLDRLGRELVRFRSYGRNDRNTLGEKAERNFQGDHDTIRDYVANGTAPFAPQRAAFGLPHNYSFSGRPGGRADVKPERHQRRASPLFLHVHAREGSAPVGVLAFLPARFLPGSNLVVSSKGMEIKQVPVPSPPELWAPIRSFLDRLLGTGDPQSRESFASVREVAF